MPDIETLWQYLTEKFAATLADVSYTTWISSAIPIQLTDHELVIELPSELHVNYWKSNLASKTMETLYELTGQEITPVFRVKNENQNNFSQPDAPNEQHSLAELRHKAKLNDKYTFETFVIGSGNQMAHAAALAVSEEPGKLYNPLFFYGGVGLGKTHLMHAIGHQVLENFPDANVMYVSSETFANDFITSIQTKTQEQFRQKYRTVDLLLVDDIQFFAEKEGTQEEFFHTFNALYDDKKQIVLTSDRLPNEIPKLQERLVSRFAWGLPVDITPPDLETRIAILRKKANAERLEIPDDTLSYIAGQIDSNIRELEGALVRVQAYATIQSKDITTSLAADALKSIKPQGRKKELSITSIQETVCKFYNVSLTDLKGKKRIKNIVLPRQIAMYLCRELTDSSLPKIGAEFGGKDHTTVIHAYDKIQKLIETDATINQDIEEIKTKLVF